MCLWVCVCVYRCVCSFQIYNEMIRDLLNPSLGFLELREDAKGNVQVAGISEVTTRSTDEVNKQMNMDAFKVPTVRSALWHPRVHIFAEISV